MFPTATARGGGQVLVAQTPWSNQVTQTSSVPKPKVEVGVVATTSSGAFLSVAITDRTEGKLTARIVRLSDGKTTPVELTGTNTLDGVVKEGLEVSQKYKLVVEIDGRIFGEAELSNFACLDVTKVDLSPEGFPVVTFSISTPEAGDLLFSFDLDGKATSFPGISSAVDQIPVKKGPSQVVVAGGKAIPPGFYEFGVTLVYNQLQNPVPLNFPPIRVLIPERPLGVRAKDFFIRNPVVFGVSAEYLNLRNNLVDTGTSPVTQYVEHRGRLEPTASWLLTLWRPKGIAEDNPTIGRSLLGRHFGRTLALGPSVGVPLSAGQEGFNLGLFVRGMLTVPFPRFWGLDPAIVLHGGVGWEDLVATGKAPDSSLEHQLQASVGGSLLLKWGCGLYLDSTFTAVPNDVGRIYNFSTGLACNK